MKRSEIKDLIIRSLEPDAPEDLAKSLDEEGVSFDFSKGFTGRVLDAVYTPVMAVKREAEFLRNLNYAFYRIALTGVAAIVLLLLSLFIMEGSLSLNAFLGINDTYDESIVCLLTGK